MTQDVGVMEPVALAEPAPAAAEPAPPPELVLELRLDPEDAALVARAPGLTRRDRGRGTGLRIVWHDSPDGALAAAGLALSEHHQGRSVLWRLERMRPAAADALWVPGTPAPVLAEGDSAHAVLAPVVDAAPGWLMPVAGFEGTLRHLGDGAVAGELVQGVLRAVAGEAPICRLTLAGAAGPTLACARDLAGEVRAAVPDRSLPAEAQDIAGRPPRPRRLGAPVIPHGLSVGDAFACVVAHLTDVILHYAPLAAARVVPEPVHQMRVALRRLRSAVALFRRAVRCPELDAVSPGLKVLGRMLGPPRDWDVFTSGTGRAVGEAFADDTQVQRLLGLAERRRVAGYDALVAYLGSGDFRRLALDLAALAALRPWQTAAGVDAPDDEALRQAEALAGSLPDYAARALSRRLGHLIEPGADVADLPAPALHEIRLHGKRMRYAAEFFAPLFPGKETRRFIRRLSMLQERLGHLNDGAVAAELMEQLGVRGYATGVVRGYVAARATGVRQKIDRSWRRFHRLEPFWD